LGSHGDPNMVPLALPANATANAGAERGVATGRAVTLNAATIVGGKALTVTGIGLRGITRGNRAQRKCRKTAQRDQRP